MADKTQIMFDHKTVATALVKYHGLHEGHWQLVVTFGLGVVHVSEPGKVLEAGKEATNPAALVPLTSVGLQKVALPRFENLTVDAAVVNPKSANEAVPLS